MLCLFYRDLMQPLLNIGVRAARRAGDLIVRSLSRLDSIKIDTKAATISLPTSTAKPKRTSSPPSAAAIRSTPFSERNRVAARQRIRLDHRSARRHYQLPAWLPDLRRLHRRRAQGPLGARGGLRSHAAGILHGIARRRRPTGGQENPRQPPTHLGGSLIGTGFPYRMDAAHVDDYLAMLKVVMATAAGVRRPGAPPWDLAYVAAGRIDGFWEFGSSLGTPPPVCCSSKRPGPRRQRPRAPDYALGPNIIAGNPKIYEGLVEAIGPLTPAALRA